MTSTREEYRRQNRKRIKWFPGDLEFDPGVVAAAFGKPDQPRDYHGRWGHSGSLHITGDHAYDEISNQQKPVTNEQRRAINEYVSSDDSYDINIGLRQSKGKITPGTTAAHLEQAIKSAPESDKPIMVHRGVGMSSEVFGTNDLSTLVGAQLKDHGFMSTTPYQNNAEWFTGATGGAMMNIMVPPKTKMLAVDTARGKKPGDERELLLAHGTALRVTDVTRSTSGEQYDWTIHAEVV